MNDDQNDHREFGRKVFQQFLDVLQTPASRASDCNYEVVWVDVHEPRCRDGLAPLASPPSFDVAHLIEGIGQSHGESPLLRREHYRSLSRRLAEPDADGDQRYARPLEIASFLSMAKAQELRMEKSQGGGICWRRAISVDVEQKVRTDPAVGSAEYKDVARDLCPPPWQARLRSSC